MKKKLVGSTALLFAVVFVFSLAGCRYILPPEEDPLAPPLVAGVDVQYRTYAVARQNIANVLRNQATFTSSQEAHLSVDYNGAVIETVYVKQGQSVAEGELLVSLNSGGLEYKMERAELAYEQATLEYERSRRYSAFDRQIAELQYQIATSTYNEVKDEYEKSRLVAPFDGAITYVMTLKPGDKVDSYVPIVSVVNPDELELTFTEKTDFSKYKTGTPVEIEFGGATYTGVIRSSPADGDRQPNSADQYVVYITPEDSLLSQAQYGKSARILTTVERAEDVLVIPANLITTYERRSYVHVLEDGIQSERDVEVGIKTSTEAEILTGLEEGELVVMK